jgi:hypothetical protein
MKNKSLFLLIALAISSCEKKYCWKCTVMSQSNGGVNYSQTTTNVCDKTESEIKDYEKAGTMTTRSNGITVYTSTSCEQGN